MRGLRDLHASVFDFATKVMTAVECQRGGSGRSCQVAVAIAFGDTGESRDISIACSAARRCVVVWGDRVTSMESNDVEAYGVRSRAGP